MTETIAEATTSNNSASVKDAILSTYGKASAAIEEYQSFARSNLDAMLEAGKIIGEGLKNMSGDFAREGSVALENLKSDMDRISTVQSPVDFYNYQALIVRRNLNSAFELTGKNTDTILGIVKHASEPIAKRIKAASSRTGKSA